jgi:thiamine pyrophosphate protein TPP binding domain protein
MKLSDYVVEFLRRQEVRDVFLLSGGGIMHLLDSLAKEERIHKYYNLHEQASGFAADGYAQYTNKLGVVFATTGPGATNVVTALASAHIDSTPLLVISGQVRRDTITTLAGVRQTGAQEVGIIPIVESVTKYAVTVMDPADIRYVLERAVDTALHGRPGAVWVDIPLDVQAAEIDTAALHGYASNPLPVVPQAADMEEIAAMLAAAKRPAILAGTGVMLAGARTAFTAMVNALRIPTVTSRRARRLFHRGCDRYFYGSAGMVAPRYANYVLQNADFLLVIGSGLRYYLTAYNDENFAPNAKKIIVNIHAPETQKLRMTVEKSVVMDAGDFIAAFTDVCRTREMPERAGWIAYADEMRARYPALAEVIPHTDGLTDGYMVTKYINAYAGSDDVYVASPSAFAYGYNVYDLHDGQEYICPVGLGSMGTGLPCAIGACIASGKKRTIIGEGDGSLQHNIQELALLRQYNLPIKIFIDSNNGYRQIYTMQQTHFAGRLAGCTPESGVGMPDLAAIAQAYGLTYYEIGRADETEEIVRRALADDAPAIINMLSSPAVEFVPIIKSRIGADGKMISSKLEDLYPFLPEEEQKGNMALCREMEETHDV